MTGLKAAAAAVTSLVVALSLVVAPAARARPASVDEASGTASGGSSGTRRERLLAARQARARELVPETVSALERWVRVYLEDRPLHGKLFVKGYRGVRAIVGGMPSGSGFVGGLGFTAGHDADRARVDLDARISSREFRQLDASLRFPTARSGAPLRLLVDASYRDYTRLRFFGLGNDSDEAQLSRYAVESRQAHIGATWSPLPPVTLVGSGGWLDPDVGAAESGRTVGDVFATDELPGYSDETAGFYVHRAELTVDLRDRLSPRAGVVVRGSIDRYDERDADAFDFTRWVAEAQLHVPLGPRSRRLVVRGRTSLSDPASGAAVPFYLMETIGGAGDLRGYREYRFRDRHNLLLNAEYRWEAWSFWDAVLFADFGKVFADTGDLDLTGMHTGYGFGLRLHALDRTILRLDLARSREGVEVHLSGGPTF